MFNSSFWIWTNFFHQVNALICFNLYLFTECSAHNNWPMLLKWWCPSPHNCLPLFWFCSSSCGGRSNFGPISVCFLFAPGKWLRWQWWQDFGPIFYPVVGRVQKWPLWALPQIERQQTNRRRWKNSRNPQNPWWRFEVKYRQKFINNEMLKSKRAILEIETGNRALFGLMVFLSSPMLYLSNDPLNEAIQMRGGREL